MTSQVDFVRLAQLVATKRGATGLRETAAAIGDMSASTLSRIEGERMQDITVSTFLSLCDWLAIDPADLIRNRSSAEPPAADLPMRVELELRNSTMDEKTARVLSKMFAAAYTVATD